MHLKSTLAVSLAAHLWIAGFAVAQTASPVEPATLRAVYDSAFARVQSALPGGASQQTSPYWPVWALGRFRTQAVGWAELRGEAYHAVAAGPQPRAWLVVVPEGSPAHLRMRSRMQTDPNTDLLVGQIAPQRMTLPWAGVFLLRQLSILADYALGAIKKPAPDEQYYATEFRGYQVELIVADLLSQGATRRRLDAILAESNVSGVEDLVKLLDSVGSFAKSVIVTVPAPSAASPGEDGLRGGFVQAALVIRYCEVRGLDAVTALPIMMRLFPRAG